MTGLAWRSSGSGDRALRGALKAIRPIVSQPQAGSRRSGRQYQGLPSASLTASEGWCAAMFERSNLHRGAPHCPMPSGGFGTLCQASFAKVLTSSVSSLRHPVISAPGHNSSGRSERDESDEAHRHEPGRGSVARKRRRVNFLLEENGWFGRTFGATGSEIPGPAPSAPVAARAAGTPSRSGSARPSRPRPRPSDGVCRLPRKLSLKAIFKTG